jgi:PIN domain nuclease of toxin-antitoxin system
MDSRRLSKQAKQCIQEAVTIWVSSVSAWEMEWKRARGLLETPDDLEATLRAMRFQLLPLTIKHAIRAARLEFDHRDPFDRMLIAQAESEGLILLTHDEAFRKYSDQVLLV